MNTDEKLSVREFLSWLANGLRRGRFDRRPKMSRSLIALIASLVAIAAIYLTLVSSIASRGRQLEDLQEELLQLQRENEQLLVDIAEAGAIDRLINRARALGFVPAEEIDLLPEPEDGP
ncbi:MAG: hypothetical protein E3J64_06750 [Anaerolineales bacterium]|nr:MAG: hypothetical protein E3J64_06750 [Anaerolineales bacterium]